MCNVIHAILFELAGTTVDSLPHSSTEYLNVYMNSAEFSTY